MGEASGELLRCLEEKGLLVEEEVLIVDCGQSQIKVNWGRRERLWRMREVLELKGG